jgi:hypothetical protein
MDSLTSSPFGKDDVYAQIEHAIENAVSEGWTVRKKEYEDCLRWEVWPNSDSVGFSYYDIEFIPARKMVIVFHGNTDIGPIGIRHLLHEAVVLYLRDSDFFPLSERLKEVFRSRSPNEYGLT